MHAPRHAALPSPPRMATCTLLTLSALALGGGGSTAFAQTAEPVNAPTSLKSVARPEPPNLGEFVQNKTAAIALGKALFWDMRVGSDGKTACASCHFQAGADSRSRNQLSPGLNRMASLTSPNPDRSFQVGGVNYQFKPSDFPFHKFSDPADRNSAVVRSHNDIASSNGVYKTRFVSATPGAVRDNETLAGDQVFSLSGVQARQVEPRNSPTMINSVFNFRNFWDGRATFLFNGVSPFGPMDTAARVYRSGTTATSAISPVQIALDNASLASLATGPALSDFEMSAAGRTWPQIGRRLLAARPLAQQMVAPTDSVLWFSRAPSGPGLTGTYDSMVKAAFRPEWWISNQRVTINGVQYTQAEANFSLFFGLAIQLYGATLVSDDSPFDRFMAGNASAMSPDAAAGMGLFFGKGKCAQCHGGAEFTNASVRKIVKSGPLARMVMGDGKTAVYDEGFYNIAITRTLEDIANGGKNGVGRPLASSQLAKDVPSAEFRRLVGVAPNLTVGASERIAIDGAFKTPTIRNAELTAPYFHNGDSLTLEQVVEFYNRGGNHFNNNIQDVDADIEPLGLTANERAQLVAFIKATTDERVRFARAPFDHPQLFVPNGHEVGANGLVIADNGRARDIIMEIPAVGATGRAQPLPNFLEASGNQQPTGTSPQYGSSTAGMAFTDPVAVGQKLTGVVVRAGWWIDSIQGLATPANLPARGGTGGNAHTITWPANEHLVRIHGAVGSSGVVARISFVTNTGRVFGPYGSAQSVGTLTNFDYTVPAGQQVLGFTGRASTSLHAIGVIHGPVQAAAAFELVAQHSGKCVDVTGSGTADGTPIIQWSCHGLDNQKWEEVPANGGFTLRSKASGKCLDVNGGSHAQGTRMHLWTCHGGDNQVFNWVGNELKVKHSGQCLNVSGGATTDGAQMIQWPCTSTAANNNFTKR